MSLRLKDKIRPILGSILLGPITKQNYSNLFESAHAEKAYKSVLH